MRLQTIVAIASIVGLVSGATSVGARSQTNANATKGQGQVSGLYATFGTTYTLKNNFNFSILKARYTLEPFATSEPIIAKTEEKLIVLDLTIKNVAKEDNGFNPEGMMTLVDDKGQEYGTRSGSIALKSLGRKAPNLTLKPGQGFGQPALHDPLQIAFVVPGKARIVKIILNYGRMIKPGEQVLRYNVAGATKEEAGAAGDPLNVIAALPDNVRDPSDKSGAVALAVGIGKIAEYEPSGAYAIRLDSFAVSTDKFNNEDAPDGKKYVVATLTAKYLDSQDGNVGYVEGGDSPLHSVTDSDGERYKPIGYRKAKQDEEPQHAFQPGDEYAFRIFFVVPKNATLKTLTLAAGESPKWAYDVSNIK
jgi:hypothetical protein